MPIECVASARSTPPEDVPNVANGYRCNFLSFPAHTVRGDTAVPAVIWCATKSRAYGAAHNRPVGYLFGSSSNGCSDFIG
ncbi:hypothetical protein Nepgr_015385 [Nepenthes gracilis]|uniref:Uncharacterized protein n=1 Tax=Nepenthes gracilis TaxID=150966 RepID=A0AAD3XR23_NEPGR|nr:hypothetical protein Nepgr_015385 [Nepenthes gracilis]